MKKYLHQSAILPQGIFLVSLFLLLGFIPVFSQQNNPITVYAPSIEPPYSPYISDYFSPSSEKWKTVVTFNDVLEPDWNVRLKITIESNKVRLQTRQDYIPPVPIQLFPSVPYTITGVDLAPYFQYNALNISGLAPSQISQNGRLPEGFYSFCIEVLDYRTGTHLSQKMCSNIWIQLNDEPITITPICGSVVRPNPAQTIPFQWHQSNMISPNSMGTEYQLVLYEITDPLTNPLNAIRNNKALKIFESEWSTQNSYLYDMTAPVLEIGKKYAYTIQARDMEGKDLFKNKGTSQPCWFWYGYPAGGTITLQQPSHFGSFGIDDAPCFKWTSPDNTIPGQYFNYHLKVVQLDSNQLPEDAINNNPVWHEEYTVVTNKLNGFEVLLHKKLEAKTDYAWQVTAYSDGQVIAVSPVYAFYGPPVIDKFQAGRHEVIVKSTSGRDLNNLSGVAVIKLSDDGKTQEVPFSNLRIIDVAGRYVLNYGTISADLEDTSNIRLTPMVEENLSAYFHPRKLKLDKQALEIYGHVTWDFPHALASFEKAQVASKKQWVNFDNFMLSGETPLTPFNQFELLDPYQFKLSLFTTSGFTIDSNKYNLKFEGEIVLPDMIKGSEIISGNVTIPFNTNQLFYISSEDVNLENNILPLQNSYLVMNPVSYIIDLSESQSPMKLAGDARWKGVYFPKFRMDFNANTDQRRQLVFSKQSQVTYELTSADSFKNWIGADGLNFYITKNFTGNDRATFNKFPAYLNLLTLDIRANSVHHSNLTGGIVIPFISNTEKHHFTCPLSNSGFEPGYLDSLDGRSFTFNKEGGEQMVNYIITRAVFADRERLDMTLDLEWPSLNVTIQSLTGFKAYGDYSIGFLFRNGTMALSQQATGSIGDSESEYPVAFDGIGAGSSNGAYAFGLTGKAVIAEDISGNEGAPAINIYSTVPNSLLPQTTYVPSGNPNETGGAIPFNASQNNYQDNLEIIRNNFVDKLYESNTAKVTDNGESTADPETNAGAETSGRNYDPLELVDQSQRPEKDSSWVNINISFNQERLVDEILTAITIAMTQPFTDKITEVVDKQLGKLTSKVDKVIDSLNVKIDRHIHKLVDSLAISAANRLKKDNFDPTEQVLGVGNTIAMKLSVKIRSNISRSIGNNITGPIHTFFHDQIGNRSNAFIESQVRGVLLDLINSELTFRSVLNNVADNLPLLLHGMGEDAFAMINMSRLQDRVASIGKDAVGEIRISEIDNLLLRAIEAEASYIVSKTLSDKASGAVNKLANDILRGESGVSASAGLGIKMNFNNLGRNLKEGKADKVVKLDAVAVKLETKFVTFGGVIYYNADDPVFGDIWKGGVILNVNLPQRFALEGIYINGRKGEMPYWFAQISGVNNSDKPGAKMDKSAKPLKDPVDLGPMRLMGASGRLYHHMADTDHGIRPDIATNYGASVNFVFFDSESNGKALRLAVGAGVEIKQDGNFVLDFAGDGQVGSPSPEILMPDPMCMGEGGLNLNYNSAESHFLGRGWVRIDNKAFCAKGNIMVDVKPQWFAVQVGHREDMIMVTPGCTGWGGAGWIGIDSYTANAGLGVSFKFDHRLGIGFKALSLELIIDGGFAAGVNGKIQYQPRIKMLEAGIWVDVWANVGVDWETPVKKGYINLVNISCKGDLLMIFEPSPTTIRGSVRGHIEVLCFGVDFNAGIEKSL